MRYAFLILLMSSIAGCAKQDQALRDWIHGKPGVYTVPGSCPELSTPVLQVNVGPRQTVFNTGWGSEQSSCLVAPHALADAKQTLIYAADLHGIESGDSLIGSFSAEVTCEIPVGAVLVWHVEIIRKSDGAVIYSTPAHGTNVSMEQHHYTFGENFQFGFPDSGDYKIQVWAISAIGNFEYQVENSHLVIENHYGSLQGTITKGPMIL